MLARLGRSVVMESRRIRFAVCLILALLWCDPIHAQQFDPRLFSGMRWRSIGPFRGGRAVAITGVPGRPHVFYIAAGDGGGGETSESRPVGAPPIDCPPNGA